MFRCPGNRKSLTFAIIFTLACMTICLIVQAAPESFSFIHISDEHCPMTQSAKTISDIKSLGQINLTPYNVTAPAPSFIIETGDETEFGPRSGAFDTLNSYYDGVSIPRYMILGNHDSTWRSLSYELRQLYGGTYYSFDKFGCHFVMLNSAGLQDPRPLLSIEEINWLKTDLEKTGKDIPVFVALHHNLDTSEWSSKYEVDRLMDTLRPYNVVLIMVGHGHSAHYSVFEGFDMVEGGSPFGGQPGFQIVSIQDGMLRIAYKLAGEADATKPMLEKSIVPPTNRYPVISITSPRENETYDGRVPVKAWINLAKDEVKSACAEVDGSGKTDLMLKSGGCFEASLDTANLKPGAHYIRVSFTGADGSTVYHHSTNFYLKSNSPKVLWRAFIGAASKSTPSIIGNTIFIGANDGGLRAYNCKTGVLRWQFKAGGAIVGQPLVMADKVYFGSDDRFFYCLSSSKGKLIWKFQADDPIYSTPITDGNSVYFGCGTGAFYSLDALSGKQNWKNTDAAYNIEQKPFITNGRVYFGAWDTYIYCVNTTDGSLVWKCVGKGSSEGVAPRYYSPADCGPVVCGGKVFAPDRKYRLSIIDAVAGNMLSFLDDVSAIGLSADGNSIYMRKLGGILEKTDSTGKTIWSVNVSMDDVPTVPLEVNGVVYVCSRRGFVSVVSAENGQVLWQYQATPSAFVQAGVGAVGSTAYVVGTDGTLTALSR